MSYKADIQWFPGHMTKALRMMQPEMKNVDAVAELLDARIPAASKNPVLEQISAVKPRVLILNKADLAEPAVTARWCRYYSSLGYHAIPISCREKNSRQKIVDAIQNSAKDKLEQFRQKGFCGQKLRVMVTGVPNVGKSTLINLLAGTGNAKTEDRPGVTRGKQWISIREFELLDVPGVLWPKFEDKQMALHLALSGAIRDEVLDRYELALALLAILMEKYPQSLEQRFKISNFEGDPKNVLERIATKRGMIMRGGEIDEERVSVMIVDEFRGGKLGRISLERPEE